MVLAGTELSNVPVIPRYDSAQPLIPLNLTFSRRREIRLQNLVPDVRSLMRSLFIVVRKPFAIDVVKLHKSQETWQWKTIEEEHASASLSGQGLVSHPVMK